MKRHGGTNAYLDLQVSYKNLVAFTYAPYIIQTLIRGNMAV